VNADWADVGGFALGGFVLSALMSVASNGIGGAGPSVATEVVVDDEPDLRILGKA
jgi:hypothetical protein